MKRLATGFAVYVSITGPALSQEFGQIVASYDGEERTWYTIALERNGETQASATYGPSVMDFFNLHVQGHPRPSFTSSDVLSVDAMFRGELEAAGPPIAADILHIMEGVSGPVWTSDGAQTPATISIETIEVAAPGEAGRLVGTFTGEVCFKESIGVEPDPTNCRTIDGRIDSRLLFE